MKSKLGEESFELYWAVLRSPKYEGY